MIPRDPGPNWKSAYGEIDLVPGKNYDRELALAAIESADRVLAALDRFR